MPNFQTIQLPANISRTLTELTLEPRAEVALGIVIKGYLQERIREQGAKIESFEKKWKMKFSEFKNQIQKGQLKKDPYCFEVEKDFQEWEAAVTLRKKYAELLERLLI